MEIYKRFNLSLMDNLCADVILGQDFQDLQKSRNSIWGQQSNCVHWLAWEFHLLLYLKIFAWL